MTDTPEKPRRGCITRFMGFMIRLCVWVMILSLLAGLGYLGWQRYSGEQALAKLEAELTKRNIELVKTKPIPVDENAAPLWRAAMALSEGAVGYDFEQDQWPEFSVRIDPKASEVFGQRVKRYEPITPLIKLARSKPKCEFRYTLPDDTLEFMGFLSETRRLIWVFKAQVNYGIATNDPQMAVDACESTIAWCDALENLKIGFMPITRCSIASSAIGDVEMTLGCLELSDDQLQHLRNAMTKGMQFDLNTLSQNKLLANLRAMRHPEWQALIVNSVMASSNMVFKLRKEYPYAEVYNELWDETGLKPSERWWDRAGRNAMHVYRGMNVGQAQMEIWNEAQFNLAFYDASQDGELTWEQHQEVMKTQPEETIGYDSIFRTRSKWTACRTALVVEQYRLKHGDWPAKLEDVFDTVPVDAYAQPMRMIRTDDGVWVYSIGADGVDHQGLGLWQDNTYKDKDDLTFRLLDPKRRNHEPEPKPQLVEPENALPNLFE